MRSPLTKHNLVNRVERKRLIEKVKNETFPRRVFSFYHYIPVQDPQNFRDDLYELWFPLNVLGRIYVAHEGINAQMSVPEHSWEAFHATFQKFSQLQNITINDAVESDKYAFFKLDIRSRKRIVADGLEENIFEVSSIGQHLSALEFHAMVGQEDVIIVDARNNYECNIGYFENAIRPTSKTFAKVLPELKEKLQDHKDKKILMYCTGGIRCEKASAYMKHQGFDQVFQLQGGIIRYANEIKNQKIPSKYKGSIFVFDERMAETVTPEKLAACQQCDAKHSSYSNCSYIPCHEIMLLCTSCTSRLDNCCSEKCFENNKLLKTAS